MVQKYYILFFDEASKRNIRVVGFGGIFYDSEGNIVAKYVWGLGQATNDQVEDYALLWGICIASEKKIVSLKVIGDSTVIIKSMIGEVTLMDRKLATIMARTKKKATYSTKISFSHSKICLNFVVDQWDNKST